jgi:hypothetical protein
MRSDVAGNDGPDHHTSEIAPTTPVGGCT